MRATRASVKCLGLCGLLLAGGAAAAQPGDDALPLRTGEAAEAPQSKAVLEPAGHLAPAVAPSPAEPAPSWQRAAIRRHSYLVPLVEVPLFNLLLTGFNAAVFREEWTFVTFASIGTNLRGGWVFDEDDFEINTVGHPYQGAVYFNATRSAGFGFWGGLMASFTGSLLWEIAGEAEPPSINDQLTTPFGGAFLGEALHRTSMALLHAPGNAPRWARILAAVLLNPVGMLNEWIFDRRYEPDDHLDHAPLLGRFAVGMNALGFVASNTQTRSLDQTLGDEVHLSAQLREGFPGVRGWRPEDPFDHFDVRAELSFSRRPFGSLFVTGLLWGRAYKFGASGAGVWGLFGGYDWANPSVLRVSTVSLGTGTSLATDLGGWPLQLQAMLVASGVGFGAAGALPHLDPDARDYHIGPGAQVFAELALVHRTSGALRVSARQYFLSGAYGEPGFESVTYFTAGGAFAMSRRFELTLDLVVSARSARYVGVREDFFQRASQVRVGIAWLTAPQHGASRPVEMYEEPPSQP